MTDERYQQIMADLGMPNSRSLLQALQKVANEVAQEQQATLRAALSDAPGESAALPPLPEPLCNLPKYCRDAIEQYARAMLAARPSVPQGEPVAWIRHDWDGTGARQLTFDPPESPPPVRDEVVRPIWTPLYARPSAPTVALTEEPRYRCGDCRHADSWGIPQTHGCQLACHYEPLNAGKEGGA